MRDVHYETVITWSEKDEAFIADVPTLPSCMSDGASVVEAAVNAEDAARA